MVSRRSLVGEKDCKRRNVGFDAWISPFDLSQVTPAPDFWQTLKSRLAAGKLMGRLGPGRVFCFSLGLDTSKATDAR